MSNDLKAQIQGLSTFLHIENQVRNAADLSEFSFITVNETHSIVSYRQAILWRCLGEKKGYVEAVSGLAEVDKNAPFVFWLTKVLRNISKREPQIVQPADLPHELAAEWQDWLPENGLLLPLISSGGRMMGALFLVREEPWQEHDITVLAQLAGVYSYTWAVLLGEKWYGSRLPLLKRVFFSMAAVSVFIGLFFIPVRLSSLAPAEVIPEKPTFIRTQLEGVVDTFHVSPNQSVVKGQPLFSLEDTRLGNRLKIAEKSLAVAEAYYLKASKEAFYSKDAKADLTVLKEHQAEKKAEVQYLKDLLQKTTVRADRDGIVIFTDVTDWIGKPVAVGEKILVLSHPQNAELEINLPVADAINLASDAEVLVFLNIDPETKIKAQLTYASYQAGVTPEGILAYRLKARFTSPSVPRIGLKGTAKIYGEKTNLFYLLMRRPFAAVRQRLGM